MASKTKSNLNKMDRTALALHGLVAVLFGVAAVFWPGLTTITLVYLLAAFLLIDGIIAIVWGLVKLNNFYRAMLTIILGMVEIAIGIFLMRDPAVALATVIILLGIVLIVRGAISFIHAFTEKESASVKALHAILGFLGLVIGIFILAQPVASGLAFVWVLGLYALIVGAIMLAMSAMAED